MPYRVIISDRAERALDSIDKGLALRVLAKIDALAENPRPPGHKPLYGRGPRWRIRVGDYRVIYSIEDTELVVLVIEIGHRREVYR